jgi:hypothetical protein
MSIILQTRFRMWLLSALATIVFVLGLWPGQIIAQTKPTLPPEVLLKPNAAMSVVINFTTTNHHPSPSRYEDGGTCQGDFDLDNYEISVWLKCGRFRDMKLSGELTPMGELNGVSIWFGSSYTFSGSFFKSVGFNKENGLKGGATWKAVMKLSNPAFSRLLAMRQQKLDKMAAQQAAPPPPVVVKPVPKPQVVKKVPENKPAKIRPPVKVKVRDTEKFRALQKLHRFDVAVIVGNKNYKVAGVPSVSFAHNDADAMRKYVIASLGYREGNIIDVRDATQAQLVAIFGNERSHEGKLFNYVRPGKSNVTVYYSGHGVPGLKDRKGYLLPVNADPNLTELNGYPIDTLFANLQKVPAKSISIFLDACFSGDSPKGMLIRSASGLTITPKLPDSADKLVVITAAKGDQFASWDEEAELGLFTSHLLLALKGEADRDDYGDGDGAVSLAEVQRYLDDEMTYQARRRFGRNQNVSIIGNGDTILVEN